MILISDLVTNSQELGQVVLPLTCLLGYPHSCPLIGSSLEQMNVPRWPSDTHVGCLLSLWRCVLSSVLT